MKNCLPPLTDMACTCAAATELEGIGDAIGEVYVLRDTIVVDDDLGNGGGGSVYVNDPGQAPGAVGV